VGESGLNDLAVNAWYNESWVVITFSISEEALASFRTMGLMRILWFGSVCAKPFNSASATAALLSCH